MHGKSEVGLGYTARPSLGREGEGRREERQPITEITITFLVLIQFFTDAK